MAGTVQQAQALIGQGALGDALAVLNELLDNEPDNTEARYLRAVAHRYTNSFAAGLADLQVLQASAPANGRAFQEEGHLRRALGEPELALGAYRRAITLNPSLRASFEALAELLAAQGFEREAVWAKGRADALAVLPKPLLLVMDLAAQNRLGRAEDHCRRYLIEHPRDVEAMRLLADIGVRLGVLEDAEFLLESALEFEPGHVEARIDYVNVLRKRQKFQAALAAAETLLASDPENPRFQSVLAVEQMQIGDYDRALALLDDVLARLPNDPVALTTRGHALKTCGRADEAVDAYRAALLSNPGHGEAYYALANLKTYRFSAQELDALRSLAAQPALDDAARVHVSFALGKALEDGGEYEEAFARYRDGNAIKRAQSRYDGARLAAEFEQTEALCSAEFFAERAGWGCDAPDPIFIVGLPRAGSTLLEQILSSHSAVDGTLELPNVLSLSQRLRRLRIDGERKGYPQILAHLTADQCRAFGEAFLEDTRVHRAGAPYFIDKMPNNFRHIGLIRLILPNSRIIDARREPMACCLSGFKQLFAEGQEFSYDLNDIGRYYRAYERLMAHWQQALPGYVHLVRHEGVIGDLETQVRDLLEFCGLPFEEQCLRYFETERNVRTPSSEQVRQPIFRDSVDQWRHFEPWLQPLKEALAES